MDLADILDALATSDFDELLRLDEATQRFYRVLEARPARESYPTLDNVCCRAAMAVVPLAQGQTLCRPSHHRSFRMYD